MITAGDKSIKLQIWDTVIYYIILRLDNSLLSPSQEDIIDPQQVLFLFMTLQIDNLSIT